MVASIIRTIFAQTDAPHVRTQFDEVARMLQRSHPKVAQMLEDAKEDLLAFTGFPQKHWRQIWSTNPLERGTSAQFSSVTDMPPPDGQCSIVQRIRPNVMSELSTSDTTPDQLHNRTDSRLEGTAEPILHRETAQRD